jgi:hypothetical protein
MPLSEHERQVLLFNLHVAMVPEEAEPEWTMEEALQLLGQVFKAGRASMLIGEQVNESEDDDDDAQPEGENIILISDMRTNADGDVTILLHHGDVAAADPTLMEIRTRKIRSAGKTSGEGLSHAAHLIISTKKHLSPSKQSRALLERVPNLGKSRIIAFLNRLLRLEAKRQLLEFVDKKTKRPKRFHPKLTAFSQMSHTLKKDLEEGKLSRIEFVTRHVAGGFEEKDRVVPVTQTIVHKVVKSPTGAAAFDLLERMKAVAKKQNFEEMQVHFRKTDTEQHVSPRFATDLADAAEAVYSRFEVLSEFKAVLSQCPVKVVPDVQKRMVALFHDKVLWK